MGHNSRPTNCSKGVGQSKGSENVCCDEIEASGTTGLANSPFCIHPFLIADTGGPCRWRYRFFLLPIPVYAIRDTFASYNNRLDLLSLLAGPEKANQANFRLSYHQGILFGASLVGVEEISVKPLLATIERRQTVLKG